MNFLRLHDPLLSILFEDDDIIAIDKPYGFNAHTNDSKIEHSDFIQDGLIEIYEKNLEAKLHIIHRLDQTTTGVMIFGKSPVSAKKYADFFFSRKVHKTYWFITDQSIDKNEFTISDSIFHKGQNFDALTEFKSIRKDSNFQLWEARPHTGRNHQIRIHAQKANIPLLGDLKYGGSEYPFLCLHNCKIEFPNGLVILSNPPKHFENLSILNNKSAAEISFEADRRERLFSKADRNQCYRLFHKKNKFKNKNFVIDQIGSEKLTQPSSDVEIKSWSACEGKVIYELRSDAKNNVGLFTHQRLQRHWVLTHSKNKNVLNLFSHTGSFALSAAIGGAAHVTSVELAKNNINWSRKNFEINGLDPQKYQFLMRDSLTYIEQCFSKKFTYDLIICDAPSFFRREKSIFKIETELQNLIEKCLSCLTTGGDFLFSTTADGLFIDAIRESFLVAKINLKIEKMDINCLLPSLDFELPDEKANLKSFLIHV